MEMEADAVYIQIFSLRSLSASWPRDGVLGQCCVSILFLG